MDAVIQFLRPWEPSLLVQAACAAALGLYVAGLVRGEGAGFWKPLAFFVGLALLYAVTQTRLDYYSQYLFFAHRGQHLVLHHVGPFLLALAAPGAVLARGLPVTLRDGLHDVAARPIGRGLRRLYRGVQQPIVAGTLFVGLIYFWLIPTIHFDAMLSRRLYWVMNWSMFLDGLLFWWMIFGRGTDGAMPPLGRRLLVLVLIVPPQILLGAYITFSQRNLFDVYSVCGRAFPISPMVDQQIGGLITWIPAAMMSVVAVLVLLALRMNVEPSPGKASSARASSLEAT